MALALLVTSPALAGKGGSKHCVHGQGYWGTHSMYGPSQYDPTWAEMGENTPFFNTGMTYYQVIASSIRKGNMYMLLGQQWIAAGLNYQNGANMPDSVVDAWMDASSLFQAYSPHHDFRRDKQARRLFKLVARDLAHYNWGRSGVALCRE